MEQKKNVPRIESRLRHGILRVPSAICEASGIVVNGRRIKSFIFSVLHGKLWDGYLTDGRDR